MTCMGMLGGGLQRTDVSISTGIRGGSRAMACIANELDPMEGGADPVLTRWPKDETDGEAGRDDRIGDVVLLTLTARVGDPEKLCRSMLA